MIQAASARIPIAHEVEKIPAPTPPRAPRGFNEPGAPAAPSASGASDASDVGAWEPILFGALAGGMGWGIRGQYGHETGASMAGLLVCLALAWLFCRGHSAGAVARAVAWGAVGWGIGGTETYGQTVGLTHTKALVGNWAALRWGMLGLGIKGAVWIGFGAAFFGMGLGGVRHRPRHLGLLSVAMVAAFLAGWWLLNTPFDVENHRLPAIYFSETWDLRVSKGPEPKPRFEVWGGLLFAFAAFIVYAGVKGDRLARNLGLWGLLGGFVGFPLGQCIQAYPNLRSWGPDLGIFGAPVAKEPMFSGVGG